MMVIASHQQAGTSTNMCRQQPEHVPVYNNCLLATGRCEGDGTVAERMVAAATAIPSNRPTVHTGKQETCRFKTSKQRGCQALAQQLVEKVGRIWYIHAVC